MERIAIYINHELFMGWVMHSVSTQISLHNREALYGWRSYTSVVTGQPFKSIHYRSYTW